MEDNGIRVCVAEPDPPKYWKCRKCKELIPYFESKCDCGHIRDKEDSIYRRCSGCGFFNKDDPDNYSLCQQCGRQLYPIVATEKIADEYLQAAYYWGDRRGRAEERKNIEQEKQKAFQAGREQGAREERMQGKQREIQFFRDAQLKNTLNGEPITCMEDFRKWKTAFDAAKREITARKQQEQAEQKAAEQRKNSYPHMDYPPKPKAITQEPTKPEKRKRNRPRISENAFGKIAMVGWLMWMASAILASLFAALGMETPAIISMAVFFLTIGGAAIMYIAALIYGMFGGNTRKAAGRARGETQKQKPEKKQKPRKPLRRSHVINGIVGIIAGVSVIAAANFNQIGYEDGYAVAGAIFVASTAIVVIINYKHRNV